MTEYLLIFIASALIVDILLRIALVVKLYTPEVHIVYKDEEVIKRLSEHEDYLVDKVQQKNKQIEKFAIVVCEFDKYFGNKIVKFSDTRSVIDEAKKITEITHPALEEE